MTKTVLCVLCLIVAVFTVLLNNLGSNVYAQEIHCPEINMLTIDEEEKFFSDFGGSLECDYDYNGYSVGVEELGSASINLTWDKSTMDETCFEYTQHWVITFDAIDSKTHYAYVYFFASWTEPYSRDSPPFLNSVQNAAIDLLRQVENSGLAAPCESADFQFNIDVPVFTDVKQGESVRIPVDVTLVKGESKEVALSTTTWQGNLGIYGWFESDIVTPTQRTYLVVQTSCNTPPDNYQFYANGVATSGSASSTDMVTVTVEPNTSLCGTTAGTVTGGQNPVWQSGDVAAMSTAASELLESGNYQEALTGYNKILEADSDNFIALFGKGLALDSLGRNEEALDTYEKALEIEPSEYGLWVNKGRVLNNLGRYDEGLKAEEKAIEIDPNSQQAWVNKGVSLENLGRYEEALAAYDKTLEINPNNEFAINNKNNLLDKIQGGGCLIATATFGSELAPQVQFLREIRDNTVLSTASGTSFMTAFNAFYYSFSPTVSDLERQNPIFRETVKLAITPLLSSLSLLQYGDIDSEAKMLGYGIGIILLNVGMYFVAPAILILKLKPILRTKRD